MTRTMAIRDFQERVHAMETTRNKTLQLTDQQARNLSREISELLATLVDQKENESLQVEIKTTKF